MQKFEAQALFRTLFIMGAISIMSLSVHAETKVVSAFARYSSGEDVDNLFCTVHSPLGFIVSSQSQSELIWMLPEGSRVKKGDVIAKQNDYHLKQRVRMLELKVEKAHIEVEFSQQAYRRLEDLPEDLRTASDFDRSRRQLRLAKTNKALMQEELKEARYRLKKFVHYAPVNGEVASLHAQLGEQVKIGQVILSFVPLDGNELKCSLPLSLYENSESLKNSRFMLESGDHLRLNRHSAKLNDTSQSLYIYLSIGNDVARQFMVGQRTKVLMGTAIDGLTEVPYDALFMESNQFYVWKILKDNTVTKERVELLSTSKGLALINSSLTTDEQVVVKGKKNLKPNQRVLQTEVK